MNALDSLVYAEVRPGLENVSGDIADRLRVAMTRARDHWMVLDRDVQFRAAIAAVMNSYGEESPEWKRLHYEVKQIGRFSAMIGALQAGLTVDVPDDEDDEHHEPIGIVQLWREIIRNH